MVEAKAVINPGAPCSIVESDCAGTFPILPVTRCVEFRLNTGLGGFNTLKTPLHGDRWEERVVTPGTDFFPPSTVGSTWTRTREIKLDIKR